MRVVNAMCVVTEGVQGQREGIHVVSAVRWSQRVSVVNSRGINVIGGIG